MWIMWRNGAQDEREAPMIPQAFRELLAAIIPNSPVGATQATYRCPHGESASEHRIGASG
jgi:hypothetical protein